MLYNILSAVVYSVIFKLIVSNCQYCCTVTGSVAENDT